MRFYQSILPAAMVACAPLALAQDLATMNLEETMKVDAIGDGVMTIKMGFNAEQYLGWQSKYGQNPSLLKRDMGKFVSQYETSDWDVQQNQMERKVTISVKIRGCVIHKGGGLFEFRVPKQWRGGDRSGNVYSYNFVEAAPGGGVIQNNVKLILPESASHFAEDKSESGDPIVQYSVPIGGAGKVLLWFGVGLMAIGAVLAGVSFLIRGPAVSPGNAAARA